MCRSERFLLSSFVLKITDPNPATEGTDVIPDALVPFNSSHESGMKSSLQGVAVEEATENT